MRALLFSSLLVALAPLAHAGAPPQYKIACKADLIGVNVPPRSLENASAADMTPHADIELGDYHLSAFAQLKNYGDPPQFEVVLFAKKKGPIEGQLNLAGAKDLAWMQVGQQTTLFSYSYLDMKIDNVAYTRVDYVCRLERTN
jgi:hypothetical protein